MHPLVRWLALIGMVSLVGCVAPFEGRYDFYQGWREGEVVRIDDRDEKWSRYLPHCSKSKLPAAPASGHEWVVVSVPFGHRRWRLTTVEVPQGSFEVGERVYLNSFDPCAVQLLHASAK